MFAQRTSWRLEANRLTQALERARAAGREVLDLTASNPTRCGFAYPDSLLDALRSPAALDYAPDPRGLLSARAAVSAYYAERGDAVAPDRLILTTSTSEAYSFLFRLLCEPGDEVLVPAPSYPLFDYLAGIQDVSPRAYPLFYDHGWHVDRHALAQAMTPRTRAVIVVHPNNPTGSYVRDEEAAALERLCAERGLALIADEVFLDFAHDGAARRSFARGGEALTFALSGVSKICGLPQMKLAWLAAAGPEPLVADALARLEVIADTYLSLSAPVQLAAPAFLAHRHAFQRELMERVRGNLATLDAQLAAHPHLRRLAVEGGWYAVVRIPATAPEEDVAIRLLETGGVLVHPGHFFDFPGEGNLVLSLIPPAETFAVGLGRLFSALASPAGH